MPLYEYVCRSCSHGFEELVRGDAVPACPACGAADVGRILSVVNVGRVRADGAPASRPAACGTCGDPRGPGACRVD